MMTVVLALGALLAWPRGDIDRWARGSVGEVATAALLERLPSRRWVVLHDLRLPGSRANVDHLVIGPSGVWVVDTKAYRSPLKAGWRKVRVGGEPLSTSAVRWEAETVAALLGVAVRPLVAVHGTGLPRRGRRCGGVWVVPAGRAVRRLRRGWLMRPVMGPSEIEKVVRNASAALLPYVNDQAERSAGTEVRSN
jgi:hypothetical protein